MIIIIYFSILVLIFFILFLLISILYKIHYSYQLENGCLTKKSYISNKKDYLFFDKLPQSDGTTTKAASGINNNLP
jgi:hypothetical protein